ncbi:MAG: polyhydroxyalkanoate synthesis repressor PhaR [Rickettsiales bacterium]|nr:polyhydroxyalkanoate synthesis repressor PhaR [Rickettsiales bacterium]
MARPKEYTDREDGKVVIKKYANRRLYDTEKSSYVTLQDLAERVKLNEDFVVLDAKTGEDLTRSVLTQIIVEEETKGENLLPVDFLKQIIGFYGENVGNIVPQYLEHSMNVFKENQDRMSQYMNEALSKQTNALSTLEDMSKANMELFEKTMQNTASMMQPFSRDEDKTKPMSSFPFDPASQMKAMQEQMQVMQKTLSEMMKTDKKDK